MPGATGPKGGNGDGIIGDEAEPNAAEFERMSGVRARSIHKKDTDVGICAARQH